jgi:hypothetical protein
MPNPVCYNVSFDLKRKFCICLMLILGAAIGWSVALNICLLSHSRSPQWWLYFGPAYVTPMMFGVFAAWRVHDLRYRLMIGITIGAVLGILLGPASDSSFEWRSARVFTDPIVAFSPTAVSIGTVVGGVGAVFLPELRRVLARINGRKGKS